MSAALRAKAGPLGRAITVDQPRGRDFSSGAWLTFGEVPFAPIDDQNLALSAALAEDGRIALGWTAPRGPTFGDRPLAPRAAVGTLNGGFAAARTLGCPCRATNGIAALIDADGAPAVAWTDNVTEAEFGPGMELAAQGGRLHLAYPGGPAAPTVIPPRVRVGARGPQRLHYGQPVLVDARCNRACDLRALVRGAGRKRPRAIGTASLKRAGRTVLKVDPSVDKTLARRPPGPVGVSSTHSTAP